jgi:ubiquinone/menaquinone biosynthesis C-methylase UbiE
MNKKNLFPKVLPSLTEEQKIIKDDFMEHWLKVLRKNYNIVDNFNHKVVIKNKKKDFLTTLEIGAGIGEHLNYEDLTENQKKNYYALEKRENVINILKKEHPDINAVHGDAEKKLPFDDNYFDRIIAIHVLEHLPNLPDTLKESSRVLKKTGLFQIVIPCEGSLAYSIARKISAERIFKKKYKMDYDWYIKSEHINKPNEIFEELSKFYKIKKKIYFPIPIPFEFCNLCISINLELKN